VFAELGKNRVSSVHQLNHKRSCCGARANLEGLSFSKCPSQPIRILRAYDFESRNLISAHVTGSQQKGSSDDAS
jgi:hypothetical protein